MGRVTKYVGIAITFLVSVAAGAAAPPQIVSGNTPITSLDVSIASPGATLQVGQTRSASASVTLSVGGTRTVGSGATWQLSFAPQIPVSACNTGAVSFSSQNLQMDASGNFSENWSPSTPNTLTATGSLSLPVAQTGATVSANLSCFTGPPTGSMAASWSGSHYGGTYAFDSAAGNIAIVGLTWASSNPSVATIDQFGKITALAPGDAMILATYGSRCWQMTPGTPSCEGPTNGSIAIHVDPAGGGGGNEENCASLILSLTPDSVVVAGVNVTATRSGQTIGPFTVPIGQVITARAGDYELQFTPPDGLTVAPDQVEFTLSCGDTKNVPLKFAPPAPTIETLIQLSTTSGAESQLLQNARGRLLAGNVSAACNQIKAFMNQVGAQAGHQLSQTDAAALLAAAAAVRTSLGCR